MTFYGANSEVWNSLLVTFYNSKIEIIIGSIISRETKLSKEMGEIEDVEKKKRIQCVKRYLIMKLEI